jgi:hypothetical protein
MRFVLSRGNFIFFTKFVSGGSRVGIVLIELRKARDPDPPPEFTSMS